jgi:hypothetical protein
MEQKTARLTVLIDPAKKKAFEELCARQDVTPSQVVRRLIREYLGANGVEYSTGEALAPRSGAAKNVEFTSPGLARGSASPDTTRPE